MVCLLEKIPLNLTGSPRQSSGCTSTVIRIIMVFMIIMSFMIIKIIPIIMIVVVVSQSDGCT